MRHVANISNLVVKTLDIERTEVRTTSIEWLGNNARDVFTAFIVKLSWYLFRPGVCMKSTPFRTINEKRLFAFTTLAAFPLEFQGRLLSLIVSRKPISIALKIRCQFSK